MKKYLKPQLETHDIVSAQNLSNLGEWLEQNQVDEDVQITTFTLNS